VAPQTLAWWLLPGCALGAALLTMASLGYARRRGLLDQPGQRRAHRLATPRGGGIAIVLSSIAALLILAAAGLIEPGSALRGGLALGAVAVIGFWDDHRPIGALPRLLVQLLAAVVLAWPLVEGMNTLAGLALLLAMVLVLTSLVNFWNFIDGINGLASVQAAWVALVLGLVLANAGQVGAGLWSLCLGAAILGFLPFNLPLARIFLGDVGSGFLGLALGLVMLWAWQGGNLGLPALVILPSAVLIDAGATLLLRMAAGRRWYTAHRSHLYQWLARRGRSHLRIVLMSLAWNLPTTVLALSLGPRQDTMAFVQAAGVYALGLAGWLLWRSRLRREAGGLA